MAIEYIKLGLVTSQHTHPSFKIAQGEHGEAANRAISSKESGSNREVSSYTSRKSLASSHNCKNRWPYSQLVIWSNCGHQTYQVITYSQAARPFHQVTRSPDTDTVNEEERRCQHMRILEQAMVYISRGRTNVELGRPKRARRQIVLSTCCGM